MENAEVARVLAEIADLRELTGGNAFKVRAYRRAAQVIDLHRGSIAELWRAGGVGELPGIGPHIAEKIGELVETGECREHARLSALVPHGVLEMLRLEGVGPKTVSDLYLTVKGAFREAQGQLEDHVRRLDARVKTHAQPAVATVALILPEEGYGFLRTMDGREIYFHERSVLRGGFPRLHVGSEVRFVEQAGDEGPQASTVRPVRARRRRTPQGQRLDN